MTLNNLEKIRAMTADELAEFLDKVTINCSGGTCESCPLNVNLYCDKEVMAIWLESEVSENDTE